MKYTFALIILFLIPLLLSAQVDTEISEDRVYTNLNLPDLVDRLQDFQNQINLLEGQIDSLQWQCGDPIEYHGDSYETVEIGAQCWFSENLNSAMYASGETIGSGTDVDDIDWSTAFSARCSPYNNDESYRSDYGLLYNAGAAVEDICPTGWVVPTTSDFYQLFDKIGGITVAGGEIKASALDEIPWNGNNSHDFTALPGGRRTNSGSSGDLGERAIFWTSSESAGEVSSMSLGTSYSNVGDNSEGYRTGASVRCLKSETVSSSVQAAIDAAVPMNISDLNNDLAFMTPFDVLQMAHGNNISTFIQGVNEYGISLVNMVAWELQGHDFYNALLIGAQVGHADFSGANFGKANLTDADFLNSNLEAANFAGAVCKNVDFRYCALDGANFRGAYLENALFGLATWGAYVTYGGCWDQVFEGANLQGASFIYSSTSCTGSDVTNGQSGYYPPRHAFQGADMTGATIPDCWEGLELGIPAVMPDGWHIDVCPWSSGGDYNSTECGTACFQVYNHYVTNQWAKD